MFSGRGGPLSGQVLGHWAGILQGDNQEGSLDGHRITRENDETNPQSRKVKIYHLLSRGGMPRRRLKLVPQDHKHWR